ncbi:MAG: acyl-CoA dehydrogenase family protein [Desulfarculaceae bacterium]|jgi:alkylation response protein AidB-like acyl-CoA dehydrogenase
MFLSQKHLGLRNRMADMVLQEIAPIAADIESTGDFPQRAYEVFSREKLFTLAMPGSHGGAEADVMSLALMIEAISTFSPSSALLVFPTNAVLRTIGLTGTEVQKNRFFKELQAGDQPMAFCLTEPDHGSDAFNLTTRAEPDGDNYIVNGTKSYITLGSHARYYLTFVRTGPGPKAGGISALMVPRDAPGLNFGPPEKKMGLHGSITSQMYMQNTPVPVANRLWEEGEGWRVLTEVANPMRVWGAASIALGVAQGLFNQALDYARTTKAGGQTLLNQQGVGFALADMKMKVEACRSLIYRVCAMADDPDSSPKQVETYTSLAKCHASDTAVEVADLASQVLGQTIAVTDSLAGRLFCAAKGIQIFDGSNQIQRLIVARNLVRR